LRDCYYFVYGLQAFALDAGFCGTPPSYRGAGASHPFALGPQAARKALVLR